MRGPTFIDEVEIYAKAGDGGDGAVAWRREKFVPRGGPAGGDGGNGGDVVLIADEGKHSLLDFKYKPRLVAKNGEPGRSKSQFGARGEDAVAKVPVGTQVFDAETGELLVDLKEPDQRAVVCRGGSGGWGNARFVTPARQAPDFAKPGLPGEERRLRLSLKLLADAGLLGFPNAGKSTFLARVSAARPKVADYPFTTLVPNLGVVRVGEGESFVLADVPGLIEGASEGAGLGIRFLKHLERVRVLCHLVEAPSDFLEPTSEPHGSRPLARYQALRRELVRFSEALAEVPEIVVLNKIDLMQLAPEDDEEVRTLKAHLDERGAPLLFMSGASGEGVHEVVRALWDAVRAHGGGKGPEARKRRAFDPLKP